MKPKVRTPMNAHTPKTKLGSGDNYGQGIRNPIGKPISSYMTPNIPKSKLKNSPSSLA